MRLCLQRVEGGGRGQRYVTEVCLRLAASESTSSVPVETVIDLLTDHMPVQTSLERVIQLSHVTSLEKNHDASTLILQQVLTSQQLHCVEIITQPAHGGASGNVQPARVTVKHQDSGSTCRQLYHSDDQHPLVVDGRCSDV